MVNRSLVLGLAVAGLITVPASRCLAQLPVAPVAQISRLVMLNLEEDGAKKPEKEDADDEKDGGEKGKKDKEDHGGKGEEKERGEKHEQKEIEQTVPMNMVPAAIMDAVKKEVPGGTITEAELEAKKGKIMYSFDVKAGDMAYDVKITVDGKFFSKEVDDDNDDEKGEQPAKPAPAEKK